MYKFQEFGAPRKAIETSIGVCAFTHNRRRTLGGLVLCDVAVGDRRHHTEVVVIDPDLPSMASISSMAIGHPPPLLRLPEVEHVQQDRTRRRRSGMAGLTEKNTSYRHP